MNDLIAIGEFLIDFTPKGQSDCGNIIFERNPGGAPANVAVQAAKLGTKSAFIGKVGDDMFGRFLKRTLDDNNVDSSGLVLDINSDTTLAFVELDATGNRAFTFYRRGTADTRLEVGDIDFGVIDNCKLLHFGSISFTDQPSKDTVLEVAQYAKRKGKIISYDPNWRPKLWKNEAVGIENMKLGLPLCDILKVSEEELALITNCQDIEGGIAALGAYGISIIVVTAGADGCYIATKNAFSHIPTYDVPVVDTTGSGDSFFGTFLHKILTSSTEFSALTQEQLTSFVRYANGAGSCCATKFGAIPAMPNDDAIVDIMGKYKLLELEIPK